MQRDITCCGCEFRVDYEWDDRCLEVEGIYIDGNDVTDLLIDSVTDKIREKLHDLYHEDMADKAMYLYEMRRYA